MNYEAAILYAQQRMREIGKTPDQYHFEPVRISAHSGNNIYGNKSSVSKSNDHITIYAFNELYILVNPQKYYGLFIIADNSSFNSDEASECGAPEFTGTIHLVKIGAVWNLNPIRGREYPRFIPVEFLRVVIY